jgi:membrane protein implicated in regulation of membrane protease activity
MQAWFSGVWGLSALVGPLVGGVFVDLFTWQWIFYINLPLGIVAIYMVWRYLEENVERRKVQIDYDRARRRGGAGIHEFAAVDAARADGHQRDAAGDSSGRGRLQDRWCDRGSHGVAVAGNPRRRCHAWVLQCQGNRR